MVQTLTSTQLFELRSARSAQDLWPMLERIYAQHPDYQVFCATLQQEMQKAWKVRSSELKLLDLKRDLEPDWFQRPDQVGYACYIDRFAGQLANIENHLDYLQDLGVNYLHLMPCLKPRSGPNDGGYSIQDYRQINPDLGYMSELEHLSERMHQRNMSLCIDLVLNHTAKEHEWAQKALAGDQFFQDFYYFFDNEADTLAYEATLLEIFPNDAPGNFTFLPELNRWVWTTFHQHQWDLNWQNPWVFLEICKIMFFLANKGVDVLRLDAVAFMWKRLGTKCQSEPEVHVILRALRACCRIVCTATLHLEEAITGPAEMLTYFGRGEHDGKEGNLAYHNNLMVQYWSALASRDTRLMRHVLATHFPETLNNATYATYLRCHDDIGWAITDEDSNALGFSASMHRHFLADFYEGVFPGSFAKGVLFQVNETTGDKRTSGTLASLAGIERGLERGDSRDIELGINRILMGTALIAAFGGVPLLYMGDEIGLLNDSSYLNIPEHCDDSRWIHRPKMDWDRVNEIQDPHSIAGRIYQGTRHIMQRRAATPSLHGAVATRILFPEATQIFAFSRLAADAPLVCLFNFSETIISIPAEWLRKTGVVHFEDVLSQNNVTLHDDGLIMLPYGRVWMK